MTNRAEVPAVTRIQLQWDEQDRMVVITPSDHDRFCLSVGEAIEACRAHEHRETFELQFKVLLNILGHWVEQRRARIHEAIVTLQDGSILFLVVRNSVAYDEEFEDDLTNLDIQVARDAQLGLIRLSVMALPHCSDEARSAFVSPELFLVFPHVD